MKNVALFVFSVIFIVNLPLSAGIIDYTQINSLTFYEKTGGVQSFTFDRNGYELTTRETVLSNSTKDFMGATTEFYDVFYSDHDGTFNALGNYVTIEAVFDLGLPNGGGLNITAVTLNFAQSVVEFADTVTYYTPLGDNSAPDSYIYAVDGDINTNTTLGNTAGQARRMSLTVGFPTVPEPATVTFLIVGFFLLNKRVLHLFAHTR